VGFSSKKTDKQRSYSFIGVRSFYFKQKFFILFETFLHLLC
jgi:hypothetical protein